MKLKQKFVALLLTSVVLLSTIPFSTAFAATQTSIIEFGDTWSLYWRQITTDTTAYVNPVYDSQALHTQGVSTTIGVSSTYTNACSASASLTAGVDAVFATMSATMGVSTTQSYSTGSSVSYNIPASTASGRYRIEHVFPRMQVKQQRVLDESSGLTIEWQRIINYAPKTNDAYRRLTRYTNP